MSGFSLILITKLFTHVLKILNYDGLWEAKNYRMNINALLV